MDCATTPKKLHPASGWMVSAVLHMIYVFISIGGLFSLCLRSCCIVLLCKGVVSDMCAEAGLVFVRRNGAVCCAAERFILTLPLPLMCCV